MRLLLILSAFHMVLFCSAQVVIPLKGKEDSKLIFSKLEILSCPKGDYNSWIRFVETTLLTFELYTPLNDSVNRIIDSVTTKFIVSKFGQLSDYQIISGTNLFLNNLAIDLLKHSGRWKPGENGNRLLNSYRTFSMKFEIDYSTKRIKYLPSQKDYWRKND